LQVLLVLQVNKATKEIMVLLVHRVFKESKANKGCKVLLVHKAFREIQVRQVHKAKSVL
jgi:hypothetical protein